MYMPLKDITNSYIITTGYFRNIFCAINTYSPSVEIKEWEFQKYVC